MLAYLPVHHRMESRMRTKSIRVAWFETSKFEQEFAVPEDFTLTPANLRELALSTDSRDAEETIVGDVFVLGPLKGVA